MDASARLALTLIYYEGLTLQEASAVLERSVSEVQALLVSARTVMRLYTDIFDRIDGTYAVISESMYQPVDYKA
jgi:DNA-directed RNA polymerase specialized sigma24 family protein